MTARSGAPRVNTSRVPGMRLSSVSSVWATSARSRAPRWGSSVHRVSAITGTSSMPLGLMMGWPTPRFAGIQSWFENTLSYRRTSAGWRFTPTSNSTVSTATPGRLIE